MAKRMTTSDTFLYREPALDGVTGGDGDAVYYCCPLDLIRHLRRAWGALGRDLGPSAFRPAGVAAPLGVSRLLGAGLDD